MIFAVHASNSIHSSIEMPTQPIMFDGDSRTMPLHHDALGINVVAEQNSLLWPRCFGSSKRQSVPVEYEVAHVVFVGSWLACARARGSSSLLPLLLSYMTTLSTSSIFLLLLLTRLHTHICTTGRRRRLSTKSMLL